MKVKYQGEIWEYSGTMDMLCRKLNTPFRDINIVRDGKEITVSIDAIYVPPNSDSPKEASK